MEQKEREKENKKNRTWLSCTERTVYPFSSTRSVHLNVCRRLTMSGDLADVSIRRTYAVHTWIWGPCSLQAGLESVRGNIGLGGARMIIPASSAPLLAGVFWHCTAAALGSDRLLLSQEGKAASTLFLHLASLGHDMDNDDDSILGHEAAAVVKAPTPRFSSRRQVRFLAVAVLNPEGIRTARKEESGVQLTLEPDEDVDSANSATVFGPRSWTHVLLYLSILRTLFQRRSLYLYVDGQHCYGRGGGTQHIRHVAPLDHLRTLIQS